MYSFGFSTQRMMALLQVCDSHLAELFTFEQNVTTNITQILREVRPR